MFRDLIVKNRSYRRFEGEYRVDKETLKELVNYARLSASGSNLQPLKYYLANSREENDKVFSTLSWAGYLKDWEGPAEGERPSAYIVILGDREIRNKFAVDTGIAAQSILLGAVERGLGGCMFASVKRDRLRELLAIPERFEIVLVIALGKPVEKIVLEEAGGEKGIKYYRDEEGVHHVPKRPLAEIIYINPQGMDRCY